MLLSTNDVDLCTADMKAIMDTMLGTMSHIQYEAKNIESGILIRHVLTSKKISDEQRVVLNDATKMLNYMKSCPLESRFFKLIKIWEANISLFCCTLN